MPLAKQTEEPQETTGETAVTEENRHEITSRKDLRTILQQKISTFLGFGAIQDVGRRPIFDENLG